MKLSRLSSKKFAAIRTKLDMTVEELADLMEIPVPTILAYESGERKIPGVVAKIMKTMAKEEYFNSKYLK